MLLWAYEQLFEHFFVQREKNSLLFSVVGIGIEMNRNKTTERERLSWIYTVEQDWYIGSTLDVSFRLVRL